MSVSHAASPSISRAAPRSGGDVEKDSLQAFRRGLAVLRLLNAQGPLSISAIVRRSGFVRTSVYRILNTLIAEGYCLQIPHSRLYCVSEQVAALSQGLQTPTLLTLAALPVFEDLAQELDWPIGLATPVGGEMRVLLASDETKPLALLKSRPGYLAPMMITTSGILSLALAEQIEAEAQIRTLKQQRDFARYYEDESEFDSYVTRAREDGFLILEGKFPEGSLGIPVRFGRRPVGGLTMRYIRAGLAREDVVARFLPRLQAAAEAIEARLHALAAQVAPGPMF